MITKIRNIKATVQEVLTLEPQTRDNDRLLMFKVWAIQNPELKTNEIYPLWEFSGDFIHGRYADPESIRRNRQILQARHVSLQGPTYGHRQKAGIETTEQIKFE